jgi:ATP-binding cassette, subfamily B, bacterial CvaB/MchF/RaxB
MGPGAQTAHPHWTYSELSRPPRPLFMEEGTSHLDMATERQVNAAMMGLGLTRIIIPTGRIASAPRRLLLHNTEFHEMREGLLAA